MTGSHPELRSFLEAEMFYGVKKRERIAYAVAGGGLAIGLMGMVAVVSMLPLKQTEAFLAVVDKDTGVAERVVSVEKAGIEQAEAIRQSLLFAYVTDRETLSYDFPRLLCDKGAAAWHGIYAGQRRGSDRGKPGASPPRRSVIAPVFSSVLNGYPGSGPG